MLLHSQSTMVANGRRTRPQIFISPQSICNDPPSTPPICGCFRGVWKLSAGRRCVVDAAVNSEPLHSGTRGINRRDCVRAIERRRLRHVGWPGFSPNGTVDSRTDALVTSAKSNGRGEAGRLSVGFYTSLSAGNLRATLVDFRQRCPQVALGMVERSRMRLVTALRNGAIDVVIATDGGHVFDSNALPLWSERVLVALPEGHQLAGKKAIYWTDLRNETVLLSHYDPGRELEDLLLAKLISTADHPKIERHDVSRGIIKTLISIGFGVSLVAESDIGVTFAGLTYREVRDGTGPSQVNYSAHWRKDNDNPALANFLKLLSERYPLPCAG
ncbi:MAG TPA: LysR family substrate-binding domain-containing protein [Burkholderiaceae bacterium]|nr:LysR family substrate-binding domain-containing protein [Burkholderiaceae bacterium]